MVRRMSCKNCPLMTGTICEQFLEEPVDLNSFTPPIARKFAWRQLELMETGLSRKAAEKMVEMELKEELE